MPGLGDEHVDDPDEASFRKRAASYLSQQHQLQDPLREWKFPDTAEEVSAGRKCQAALFDAGFAGITIPEEYGGAGLTLREELIWAEEAASYELPLSYLLLGLHLCAPTLVTLASEELRQRYLRPLLRGDAVWCQLFSEPNAGSDLGSISTRARRDGDDWIVSGQKVWTTVAQFADMGMLVARTGDPDSRHHGLTMFVLDMASPGVTVRPITQITGTAEFNEVFLDDVRIPHGNVVGEVGRGWAGVLVMLMNERVALASSGGDATSTDLNPLADLARSTGALDRPDFRQDFARLFTRNVVITLLANRLRASLRGGDHTPGPEGSIAKLMVSQVLRERADLMLAAAGPAGVWWSAEDSQGGRWSYEMLAAPAVSLGGGTDQIQRNVLSERLLGMPREPSVRAGTTPRKEAH